MGQFHQKNKGREGGGQQKSHVIFFSKRWLLFGIFCVFITFFLKNLNVSSHTGGGGSGYRALSSNDTEGGGLKLDKKVYVP
jgi:hypothetical protein